MPLTQKNECSFAGQAGSSLIETLVGLFILAVGLLGILAMQTVSVNSNQRAQYSSEVAVLASDIADGIYSYLDPSNPANDDDFDGVDTLNIDAGAGVEPPDCSGGCGLNAELDFTVFNWAQSIQNNLPSGRGTIDFSAADNLYTVTILWDSERTGATGDGCSGNPQVDLTCYAFQVPVL